MRSRQHINTKALNSYKPIRALLCTLVDKNQITDRLKKSKEMQMFIKLYKNNGKDCTYLLALCKAIHITNKELYNTLLKVKL